MMTIGEIQMQLKLRKKRNQDYFLDQNFQNNCGKSIYLKALGTPKKSIPKFVLLSYNGGKFYFLKCNNR